MRSAPCRELCDDYAARIRRMEPLQLVEVKDARGAGGDAGRAQEGERILAQLPPGCVALALDERGPSMKSEELARFLRERRDRGTKDLRFVIGGAYGLSPAVLERCNQRLSLSAMTLPHELARAVFLEQLYRAWTLLHGVPYHHA